MSSKFANCKIVMYDEDNNVMWTRSVTNQRGYQIKSLVEKDNGAAREEERDRTRSKAILAHLFNT
jgi:hypothetical protein